MPFDVVVDTFRDPVDFAVDRAQQVAIPVVVPVVFSTHPLKQRSEDDDHEATGAEDDCEDT